MNLVHSLIEAHFRPIPLDRLSLTERRFPHRVRADLQRAVDSLLDDRLKVLGSYGLFKHDNPQWIDFAELLILGGPDSAQAVPPLYEEIDIGEALEAALASRPGRVDQAIEFPLPDDEGRAKLVRLYARGMEVPEDVLRATVQRTEGVGASFIKESMRRSAQFHLERDGEEPIALGDVEAALDELLLRGGSFNRKRLGGRVEEDGVPCTPWSGSMGRTSPMGSR